MKCIKRYIMPGFMNELQEFSELMKSLKTFQIYKSSRILERKI